MFKTAVGNVALIPLKITVKEGSVSKRFEFSLTAIRKSITPVRNGDQTGRDFLLENITDWGNQRIVLLENGEPAPFGRESFEYMLDELSLESVIFNAYVRECGGKEKN
jgi:hypothetical protein